MASTLVAITRKPSRDAAISEIRRRLVVKQQNLAQAIRSQQLYFRVSVVGTCNLSCDFCHNEGAPTHGKLKAEMVDATVRAAVNVGFTRVQFTGGEPLLHKELADFIRMARSYVDDVGVTTNGTALPHRLEELVAAGLYRLHVSLQTETLVDGSRGSEWSAPAWLMPTIERASRGDYILRLNLPIPAHSLTEAERFLVWLTAEGISAKVFSLLPKRASGIGYPLGELEDLVKRVNANNGSDPNAGRVDLRGYRPPTGFRCGTCHDLPQCRELSHSLRLGADLVLRPCLATRDWDMPLKWPLDEVTLEAAVREQAILALDYE